MYTPNDILNLRLKYRQDHEIIKLLDFVETAIAVEDRVEELEDEVEELKKKKTSN